jgi:hypothetical protein
MCKQLMFTFDFNLVNLEFASQHFALHGHRKLVKQMVLQGCRNFQCMIEYAMIGGHTSIRDWLIQSYGMDTDWSHIEYLFLMGAVLGNKDMCEFIYQAGARNVREALLKIDERWCPGWYNKASLSNTFQAPRPSAEFIEWLKSMMPSPEEEEAYIQQKIFDIRNSL